MASGGVPAAHLPLWDKDNKEQQSIVSTSPQYKDLLNRHRADLIRIVDVSPLWVYLRQYRVIDRIEEETLKHNATNSMMVERLLDFLERNPLWKLHGFLRACTQTSQEHVIPFLGLELNKYDNTETICTNQLNLTKEKTHYYTSESGEKVKISGDQMNAILQHCESYKRNLMQTTLFGFRNSKLIDLTQLYVSADTRWERNERETIKVTKKEIFGHPLLSSSAHTVQFEGPPGAGKTTYLMEYAHSWSQDMLACHEKGPEVECQDHEWKLIVHLPAGSFRATVEDSTRDRLKCSKAFSVEDAIKDNLKCNKALCDQTMAWIQNDGHGVLIIQDAVDEVHSEYAKEILEEYTKSCKEITSSPKVLISTRTALCPIPAAYFDRCISIEGFTREQGTQFVEKFFKERYSITDHCILEYVRAHQDQLEMILCNPLRALIFSELTAKGALTLQQVKTLNPIKLLKSLEGHILRREGERRSLDSKSESERFYKLCLQSLLADEREFDEKQMAEMSAYKAFLVKQTNIDDEGQDSTTYVPQHEMIFEYFAVRGLLQVLENNPGKKDAILLYLCSNPNMRNILQFASAFICQYKPELFDTLISIIRACLILQSETPEKCSEDYANNLKDLEEEIKQMLLKDAIQRDITEEESRRVTNIWSKINTAFTDDAQKLRDVCWFRTLYHNEENWRSSVLPFVAKCQQQGTLEQQKILCSQTTHCLLPCSWSKDRTAIDKETECSVLPVDGIRWIGLRTFRNNNSMTQMGEDVPQPLNADITAWCPTDALVGLLEIPSSLYKRKKKFIDEILSEWKGHIPEWFQTAMQKKLQSKDFVTHPQVNIDCTALWGQCPSELMTDSIWEQLLQQILHEQVLEVVLYLDKDLQLQALFDCLSKMELIFPRHLRCVSVWGGEVQQSDLQRWFSEYPPGGLCVDLYYTTIVVPREDSEISVIENNQCKLRMGQYVTQTGFKVNVNPFHQQKPGPKKSNNHH